MKMNGLTRWQRPLLARWPTFGRLSDLQQEIDQLFGPPLTAFVQGTRFLTGWTPALDVHEDKDNVYVRAELPGMKREEIEVSLHDGTLSISGQRKHEEKSGKGEVHRSERFFGRFQRTISLPATIAVDKVKAGYEDGVLTVTLPKTEEAKPKRIDVSVN